MSRLGCIGAIAVVLLGLGMGCVTQARQPKLSEAMITPARLKPGDTALITVRLDDRHGIVGRVQGVVNEDTQLVFELHDDGEKGDVKAGDGIWSLWVDVPFLAPKGEFQFELTAYDSKGRPIPVRDLERGTVPLTATFTATVDYPAE